MVRQLLKEVVRRDGGAGSSVVLILWAAFAALSVITAIMFSCGGGSSKDKASATHADAYGSTCAAGCGGGCGG
ncbi:hypothetical protein CCACVL1_21623 [Corchorus capsularis]|uniref:Uncharacterized protein n=1 Tax=Corchorus capsularis TaxID=210143 RepID=A0A1R3H2V3_COCAP|nr:hypothetical protein CCACVL1_21623 [Corchorus capsularis]